MQFSLITFIFVFFVFIAFYLVRVEARKYILSIACLAYPFLLGKGTGCIVIFFSLLTYLCGLCISLLKKRKKGTVFIVLSIIAIIVILFVLKNITTLKALLYESNLLNDRLVEFIKPIGISFYALQGIGYLIDIYNGKVHAVLNPLIFHLYISWFPRFISGPIESASAFFAKIDNLKKVRLFENNRLRIFVGYALMGCFFKLVVADRIAPIVNNVFDTPECYSGYILFFTAVLYSIQIYCDFAGYSMFVMGISQLFGIELTNNFRAPYMSKNIKEFWDRWHVSLSSWLAVYIYIPLGGNRKGQSRQFINIICVFLISALWHGTGLTFLIWGLLHGIYSITDNILEHSCLARFRASRLCALMTFLGVTFAWIFFRASSINQALKYIKMMFVNWKLDGSLTNPESFGVLNLSLLVLFIFIVIAVDFIISKKDINHFICKMPLGRWLLITWIMILIIFVFGVYGPKVPTDMIYMNF